MDYAKLHQLYSVERRQIKEIANIFGVSVSTIMDWVRKHSLTRVKPKELVSNAWHELLDIKKVAIRLDMSPYTVRYHQKGLRVAVMLF